MGLGGWLKDRWGRGPSMGGLRSSIRGTGRTLDNKWVKTAIASGLAATGVGAPAAAAIMAGVGTGAKLARGQNIGQALKQGAVDGVMTYGAGKLAGAVGSRIPGVNRIPGMGGDKIVSDEILKAAGAAGQAANQTTAGGLLQQGGRSIGNMAQQGLRGLVRGGGADGRGNFGTAGDVAGKLFGGGAGGGEGGEGGGGMPDWLRVLGMGGMAAAGVGAYRDADRAQKQQEELLGKASGLLDEYTAHGRDMMARSRPIATGAEAALLARIQAGPRKPTSLAGISDTGNPYRSQFRLPVPPPPRTLG